MPPARLIVDNWNRARTERPDLIRAAVRLHLSRVRTLPELIFSTAYLFTEDVRLWTAGHRLAAALRAA